MVSVCIPFFLLIVILQTQAAMQAVRRSVVVVKRSTLSLWTRITSSSPSPPLSGGGVGGTTGGVGNEGRRRFRRRRRGGARTHVNANGAVTAKGDGTMGLVKKTHSQVQVQMGMGIHGQTEKGRFWPRVGLERFNFWGWERKRAMQVGGEKDGIV